MYQISPIFAKKWNCLRSPMSAEFQVVSFLYLIGIEGRYRKNCKCFYYFWSTSFGYNHKSFSRYHELFRTPTHKTFNY